MDCKEDCPRMEALGYRRIDAYEPNAMACECHQLWSARRPTIARCNSEAAHWEVIPGCCRFHDDWRAAD